MTLPSATTRADRPDDDASTAHDKAVDLVLHDRAMVSRLLREHQVLRMAVEQGPMVAAVHDAKGHLVACSALYEQMHPDALAQGRAPAHNEGAVSYDQDYGESGIFRVHDYTLPGGGLARFAVPLEDDTGTGRAMPRKVDPTLLLNLSHEIRTPLNGIVNMARLLVESGLSKGQQMYADVVLRSGEALVTATNDILDLTNLQSGRMVLAHESFDFADCIESTATLFAPCADDKGIDLILRIDPVLPRRLIGDEQRIRQVVTNLIGNAIHFTDEGHVLLDIGAEMTTREDGRRVARLRGRVEDTGIGISPERCGMLFDGNAPAQEGQGTGLGLLIVEGLLAEMGGSIAVESVEGQGTTFTFTVDLAVDAAETMRRARESAQGKRVLLLDAAGQRRSAIAESTKAWGFQVASCHSAREAIALLDAIEERGQSIDLILLGERVDEGDSTVFTRHLKSRTGLRPPVILMARLAALSMCDADEEAGVTIAATLPRPVESSSLLAQMEKAVRLSPYVSAGEEPYGPCAPSPGMAVEAETDTDTHAETEAEASPTPAIPGSSLDILVAEDNKINQMLIGEILRDTGYSYQIVGDGKEAVEAWRTHRPRLILMDVSMPAMSGDEATMQIRAEEEGRSRVPIIAVTAHALRGDRERCMRAGMDDHLTKPVTITAIRETVASYLEKEAECAAG